MTGSEDLAQLHTGKIYTVSQLTGEIKSLLEEKFPFIWITGEISNYSVPSSGHAYFTLKDRQAVIQAVMFKKQKSKLKFHPENGMKIFGLARLTLYEPRGVYQLFFEHLEPDGIGSLQIAFEQLKLKLAARGLFEERHKKSIPFVPSKVCVITSLTGAAVQDIITVSRRRFDNCCLEIFPVRVQGDEAIEEICDALRLINDHERGQVIVLARGGGSVEDLQAFNSEAVAEAVFASRIPVITGIGHETDFTIADFVADLRAPTPSAAAELVFPDKRQLIGRIFELKQKLDISIDTQAGAFRKTVTLLQSRLRSPESMIDKLRLKIDDETGRLNLLIQKKIERQKEKIQWITEKLNTLSPLSVLSRGYSITRFPNQRGIITDAALVCPKDRIDIILHKGHLTAKVETSND